MPTLDSDAVAAALKRKMKAVIRNKHDVYYDIYDAAGQKVCFTRISHGPKETLRSGRVREMALQLRLDDDTSLVNLVDCSLDREHALQMMKKNPRHAPYLGK
jgi:hypothetical protein